MVEIPWDWVKVILINYNTQQQICEEKNCLITDNCQQEQKKKPYQNPVLVIQDIHNVLIIVKITLLEKKNEKFFIAK